MIDLDQIAQNIDGGFVVRKDALALLAEARVLNLPEASQVGPKIDGGMAEAKDLRLLFRAIESAYESLYGVPTRAEVRAQTEAKAQADHAAADQARYAAAQVKAQAEIQAQAQKAQVAQAVAAQAQAQVQAKATVDQFVFNSQKANEILSEKNKVKTDFEIQLGQ